MATQAQLVQRVFDHLYGTALAERPALHQINGGITDSAVSLTVDDTGTAVTGSILEFEDNSEQVYVESIPSEGSADRTIKRARNGTTAAAHADNAVFAIDPVYTRKQVLDALISGMYGLQAEGLYVRKTGSLVLAAGQDLYEMSETDVMDGIGAISVFYQEENGGDDLHALPFLPINDTGAITGPAIRLLSWGEKAAGDTINYIYAARIDSLGDSDSDPALEELLVLGAVYRMLSARTGARTHNPGRMTDRTVQPGQSTRDATWFLANYKRLVNAYRASLHHQERRFPRHPRFNRALRWRW